MVNGAWSLRLMFKVCMLTTSEIYHDTRILNEAAALVKKYEVTILARKYPKQRPQKYPFQIKLIDFLRLPIFQLNIFSSLFSLIKAAFYENSDIYHAHDLDGLLCAFPAAFIKRKVLIYDSHELWSDTYPFANLRGMQWLLPILEKMLIWRIQKGITVNQTIAQYLSRKYHKEFIALYNIPRISKITHASSNLRKLFPNKQIILHLGATDEGRGMEEMIAASQYLSKDYALVFVGGGKIENQLEEMLGKLNLKDKVFLFKAVPPEEIPGTIKQADLGLALTQKISKSYYFSLPNKIFQYIAAQVPILGSNLPEFKKIILQNKIGEVVEPSKPKLIARKIIHMLKKSPQKRYRHNLVGLAKEKYNWKAESEKLRTFYDKIQL